MTKHEPAGSGANRAPAGPVLALDLGRRRIGVALSDPGGRVAARAHVYPSGGGAEDPRRLAALARDEGVTEVVVGLPRRTDGREGPEAGAARAFAARLQEALAAAGCPCPVRFWDERFTTRQAAHSLREQGVRARQGRQRVDARAAVLILQSYLDWRQRGHASGEGEGIDG